MEIASFAIQTKLLHTASSISVVHGSLLERQNRQSLHQGCAQARRALPQRNTYNPHSSGISMINEDYRVDYRQHWQAALLQVYFITLALLNEHLRF